MGKTKKGPGRPPLKAGEKGKKVGSWFKCPTHGLVRSTAKAGQAYCTKKVGPRGAKKACGKRLSKADAPVKNQTWANSQEHVARMKARAKEAKA